MLLAQSAAREEAEAMDATITTRSHWKVVLRSHDRSRGSSKETSKWETEKVQQTRNTTTGVFDFRYILSVETRGAQQSITTETTVFETIKQA